MLTVYLIDFVAQRRAQTQIYLHSYNPADIVEQGKLCFKSGGAGRFELPTLGLRNLHKLHKGQCSTRLVHKMACA